MPNRIIREGILILTSPRIAKLTEGPRRPCACTGVNAHPLRLAPAQGDLL